MARDTSILRPLTTLLLVVVSGAFGPEVLGQPKRGDPLPGGPSSPGSPPVRPKRGDPIIETEDRPKSEAVFKERIKRITVRPDEGALVLLLVPGARVTLHPLAGDRAVKSRDYDLDRGNLLTIPLMSPGKYQLGVKHPDYSPFSEVITIPRGGIATLQPPLVAKYGAIVVGGAPPGARFQLDGRELDPSTFGTDEQGQLILPRVEVGARRLRISCTGYDDDERPVEVKPGDKVVVSANLPRATITLTVRSRPGARVYLGNAEKGIVQRDGTVTIEGLAPGAHRMRVTLDGYEVKEESLELALSDRRPVREVELVPIAVSSEASATLENWRKEWTPPPAAWRAETGAARGLLVGGDEVALFKDATERREFNVYTDFRLELDLRFSNGQGAAWVLRAKDRKNYYLFELTPPKGEGPKGRLNFYLCRDGELELKKYYDVPANLDRPGDAYHVTVTARGAQFRVELRVNSDPRRESNPIGNFSDQTFSYGGVGFRAPRGMVMLVQNFVIIPQQGGGPAENK